jgi:hypothetical protein
MRKSGAFIAGSKRCKFAASECRQEEIARNHSAQNSARRQGKRD